MLVREMQGDRMASRKVVMVSGGFDPLHIGHVRMIAEAYQHGDVLAVVNSDAWLMRKKGYVFMPWADRAEIVRGLRCVWNVEPVDDADGSVCDAIRRLHPDIFVNGGDRTGDNIPEYQLCEELGIEMIFGVGGGKIRSSSQIVAEVRP